MGSLEYLPLDDVRVDPLHVSTMLGKAGIACIDFNRSVGGTDMLDVAYTLGSPMKEVNPLSLANADPTGHILRISSTRTATSSATEQVHSTSDMGWHVDHALAPAHKQPRFLGLGCETPPQANNGGQTLVASSDSVLEVLSGAERELLAQAHQRILDPTIMAPSVAAEPVIRVDEKCIAYISYWDAGEYGHAWDLDVPEGATASDGLAAVMSLRKAADTVAQVIEWRAGLAVFWDNRRFLHARTPQLRPSDRALHRAKIL